MLTRLAMLAISFVVVLAIAYGLALICEPSALWAMRLIGLMEAGQC